jgi:hypothetical protein
VHKSTQRCVWCDSFQGGVQQRPPGAGQVEPWDRPLGCWCVDADGVMQVAGAKQSQYNEYFHAIEKNLGERCVAVH